MSYSQSFEPASSKLFALFADIGVLRYESGRDARRGERENPDPPLLFLAHVEDQRKAFLQAARELHVLPVRPHRRPVQLFAQPPPRVLRAQQRFAPARVHHEPRLVHAFVAVRVFGPNRHRIRRALDVDVLYLRFFLHLRAQPSRVVEQHLIEFRASHLKGKVGLVLDDVFEAPRRRNGPLAPVEEPHARLAHEALLQLVEHSELFEQRVAKWQQRFSHVLPGKFRFLEQYDVMPSLRQERS